MRILFTALAAGSLIGLSGCASITQGTSQTLAFKIEPKEATCVLTRVDDGELGSVSGKANTIEVHKDKDDIVVKCSASGYNDKTTRIVSKAGAAGVTGVMLDFGITDMITGAMYAYPSDINIVMENDGTKTADQQAVSASATEERKESSASATAKGMTEDVKEKKLTELKHLKDKGLISKEVYVAKQNEILNAQ